MDKNIADTVVVIYSVLNAILSFVLFISALAITFLTPFAMTMMLSTQPVVLPEDIPMLAAQQLASGLGIIAGVLLFLLSALFLALCIGLWRRRTWARHLQLVVSIPQVLGVPFGTIVGGFGIYSFGFDKEIRRQFSENERKPREPRSVRAKKK